MKSNWYFEVHGKAEGPITTSELIKKIQAGELKLLDLVFREGDAHWMPVENFPELKEVVEETAAGFKLDADWIILRRYERDGKMAQEQIGPFSSEQVLKLLDRGTIQFTDFVWRTGYESWAPLGRVDEFEAPLKSSVVIDKSLYEKPRRDILEGVPPAVSKAAKAYKPPSQKDSEDRPEEASGEDLARPLWTKIKSSKKRQDEEPALKETKTAKSKNTEKESPANERPTRDLQKADRRVSSRREDEKHHDEVAVQQVQKRWLNVANLVLLFVSFLGLALFAVYGPRAYKQWKGSSGVATTTETPQILFETVDGKQVVPPPPKQAPMVPPQPAEKPVVAAQADVSVPSAGETPVPNSTNAKQISYFKNRERLHLFYQSQKGLRLIADAEKLLQKKKPKKKGAAPPPPPSLKVWLQQVASLRAFLEKDTFPQKLYPELHKKLLKTTIQLSDRGREVDMQLAQSRGLSKTSFFKDIEIEFKSLLKKARELE